MSDFDDSLKEFTRESQNDYKKRDKLQKEAKVKQKENTKVYSKKRVLSLTFNSDEEVSNFMKKYCSLKKQIYRETDPQSKSVLQNSDRVNKNPKISNRCIKWSCNKGKGKASVCTGARPNQS